MMNIYHKRDQGCIWFSHLSAGASAQLARLAPETTVDLAINGQRTTWVRMKPGAGSPTRGIRIAAGREVWAGIALGGEFTLEVLPRETTPETAAAEVSVTRETSTIEEGPRVPALVRVPTPGGEGIPLFGAYLFIDYSGAENTEHQRRTIRIAYGEGGEPAALIQGRRFDRAQVVDFVFEMLRSASARGVRVCFGQDHVFGLPFGFARDLGLSHLRWRDALDGFVTGSYDPAVPALTRVDEFARGVNQWLVGRAQEPYFWSATKAGAYDLPGRNPRGSGIEDGAWRLTDLCRHETGRGAPKPFNRLGDPGTVGGQSLLGMAKLRELMQFCEGASIKLRFWPFDGLDITAEEYRGAHVGVEPYPSAMRPAGVEQTDENDALHSALYVQAADRAGELGRLFDLTGLQPADQERVRFEGWILGNRPAGTHHLLRKTSD
jgi:hypothetical protein